MPDVTISLLNSFTYDPIIPWASIPVGRNGLARAIYLFTTVLKDKKEVSLSEAECTRALELQSVKQLSSGWKGGGK